MSYAHRTVSSSYQSFLSPLAKCSHPLLQDFLAVVMDTMTMHINPQYKHITMFYWSTRLSCCLQKSIAKSLSRKYSASNGLAAKGVRGYISVSLTVSILLSEISLSYLLVWLHMPETMIVILVRRTRSLVVLTPLTNYIYTCVYIYIHIYECRSIYIYSIV